MKFERLRFGRTGNVFEDLHSLILEVESIAGDIIYDVKEGIHDINVGKDLGIPDMTKRGIDEIKGITNYRSEMEEYAKELIQLKFDFFEQLIALENKYNICRREAMLLLEGIKNNNK